MSLSAALAWISDANNFLEANQTIFLSILLPFITWLVTKMSLKFQERRASADRKAEREHQRRLRIAEFRQQWINELRSELAALIVLSGKLFGVEGREPFECIAMLTSIQMRMNRNDPNYRELEDAMLAAATTNDSSVLAESHAKIMLVGQRILKAEWERLKYDLGNEVEET